MGSFKDKLVQAGVVSPKEAQRAAEDAAREKADAARAKQRAIQEAAAARHVASARAYPGAAPITMSEVRALLAPYADRFRELPRTTPIDGALDPEVFTLPSAQLVDGDLALDELVLEPEGSNLFVRGDLRISGVLRQHFRAGGLVVFGRLSARHVVTTGAILCLGDLDVPGTLYGNCTNYMTDVLGRATVGTLISVKEHLFSFWGSWSVGGVIDVQGRTPNLERYGPPETRALRDEVHDLFDDDEVLATLREHDTLVATA